jgi:hypothetical protein
MTLFRTVLVSSGLGALIASEVTQWRDLAKAVQMTVD